MVTIVIAMNVNAIAVMSKDCNAYNHLVNVLGSMIELLD